MNDLLFELPADENTPDWANQPIAVFDLETTGLDHKTARIVTACAALIDANGKQIGKDIEWLANPGIPIPAEATAVHGITDEIAAERGSDLATVVSEIVATLRGYFDKAIPVVAYNAPYDFTILRQHAEDFGIEWPANPMPVIDPLVIDKNFDTYRKGSRKLEAVAAHYGVSLTDAHNATADAIAAGRIAQALARKFAAELSLPLSELHSKQIGWSAAQDASFEAFLKRSGKPDAKIPIGWPEKPR